MTDYTWSTLALTGFNFHSIKYHGGFYILFRSALGYTDATTSISPLISRGYQSASFQTSPGPTHLFVRGLFDLQVSVSIAEVFTKPELLVQVLNSTPSFCRSNPTPHAQFAKGTRP
ncbi:hypothetical protein C8R41DRAFT_867279 [Lentinula lateritia]|uniref:Uncharacterized protein n=1 Tax=Lentinula lateritia TaxID=40482 RepID=A0ABQ8VKM8_9AGAR|nr:hypothetical protein C8R41DRAFT_867279 [Lentinula lateritia]